MKKPVKKPNPRKMRPAKMWATVASNGWLMAIHATKGEAISWASGDERIVRVEIREI